MLNYRDPIVPGGAFTWAEYARLKSFRRYATPSPQQHDNAIFLFEALEPLRQELGLPLIITSGARTTEYTNYLRQKGIPAARYSAHNDWQAVDLSCPKLSTRELWHFFDKHWLGRMELLLYTPTWVHLDTRQWGQRIRFKP